MSRCRSTPKITKQDRRLPMIDFQKRVIDFGDDQLLFKIVSKLIMDRVDLGPVDHGRGTPLNFGRGIPAVIDLDAIAAPDDQPSAPDAPIGEDSPDRLSARWGIEWHRDRYGRR